MGAIERAERSCPRMPESGSSSTRLVARSARRLDGEQCATGELRARVAGRSRAESATAPGSPRANASRHKHERFERHADEGDRQHDDEVSERTGRASSPEMMDREVRRDDDVGVQSDHRCHREAPRRRSRSSNRVSQANDGDEHVRVLASDVGRSEVPSRSHHLLWYGTDISMHISFASKSTRFLLPSLTLIDHCLPFHPPPFTRLFSPGITLVCSTLLHRRCATSRRAVRGR